MFKEVDVDSTSQCDGSSYTIGDLTPELQQINTCITATTFASCKDVLDQCGNVATGWYTIQSAGGAALSMYCDMDGGNCDDKGGWTRVALLNSTDTSYTCPGELETGVFSGKRVCIDKATGCDSAFFPVNGISYSEVCGYGIGYQYGTPDSFGPQRANANGLKIDQTYVDGISITYGSSPRNHIWTLVGGNTETDVAFTCCPCNVNSRSLVPAYVKNNYYCESGVHAGGVSNILYPDDPIWDGKNCGGLEDGCCTNPKMPWWYRDLDDITSDDIEVRLCNNGGDEAPTLELMEVFVR